jgi:hypothetical protein
MRSLRTGDVPDRTFAIHETQVLMMALQPEARKGVWRVLSVLPQC